MVGYFNYIIIINPKTHGKIPQSIDMLIKHGTTELGLSLQSAIANGQFAEALSSHSQGNCC